MKTLTRIAVTTAATLALVGSTVALTAAPAEAASKRGTIITAEATKVYKGMLRQKCLTVKETRKIVHGQGYLTNDGDGYKTLYYDGTKKSRIDFAEIYFYDGCAYWISSWKK